ncbi:Crp/Fnr family transcriptional regulator [bacterium]|nr:Crp/Fnr family transcriptional regulator [bacterium]
MKPKEPQQNCHSCRLCYTGQQAQLLKGASLAGVDALERARTGRLYPVGAMLYHQGSCGDALFCVSSGRIKIYRTDPTGRTQILRIIGPGSFLGFRRLLSQRPSSNAAQVVSSAFVCQIPGPVLLATLAGDPQIAWNILSSQARALEETESQLLKRLGLSCAARVASLLLELSDTSTPAMVAPLSRQEIAQLTGTSIESVSRVIQEMARQRSLQLHGRSIVVTNRQALEELIEREYRP